LIYNKIRQLCAERGISTREIERACGLGFRSIENWKTSSPTVANLKAVADYFGVTVDELLRD
jgi:transcriptional regulator with XRE-family HTH domain